MNFGIGLINTSKKDKKEYKGVVISRKGKTIGTIQANKLKNGVVRLVVLDSAGKLLDYSFEETGEADE